MSIKLSTIIHKKITDDQNFNKEVKLTKVTYEPNEKILSRNEKYSYFCIILKGRARVNVKKMDNSFVGIRVSELFEDDVFGEFSLFDDSRSSADIISTTRTEVLQIDKDSFIEFLKKDPLFLYAFAVKIMQYLFQRIREDNKKITSLLDSILELQKNK